MTQFYADAITRESEDLLRRLRTIAPDAVVLGGWATFLLAGGQRSRDVDVAVTPSELTALQREFGAGLTKNMNLRKYEVTQNGIDLDILVSFFSNPGIPIEEVMDRTRVIEGFHVVSPEGLLLLKLCAWIDRQGRPKGDKDEVDVITLLRTIEMDWDAYRRYTGLAEPSYRRQLEGAIGRLIVAASIRRNWRALLDEHGRPAVTSEHAWRREMDRVRPRIPTDL